MKNKKLLIITVMLAIIAVFSISLNIYFIASNPSNSNTDATNNANTSMTMFTKIESVNFTEYEKKSFEKTETQDAYDMYTKSSNFFDKGSETLSIKKSGDKISLARLIIKTDSNKVKSVEELSKIITDKLISEGHVAEIIQYTKITDNKVEKIESLAEENIKDADRVNIVLKLKSDIKDKIVSINLSIKTKPSDNGYIYEATINYIYERPTSSAQPNTPPNNTNNADSDNSTTDETHSHNH